MTAHICANCCRPLYGLRATGYSSLYNHGDGRTITLCEPCWLDEEAAIDEAGRNDLPDRRAGYLRNLGIVVADR